MPMRFLSTVKNAGVTSAPTRVSTPPLRVKQSTNQTAQSHQLLSNNREQREIWNQELLKRLSLRSAEEFARECLGSRAEKNARQLTDKKRHAGEIFSIQRGGMHMYPAFQINSDRSAPYPEVAQLIAHYPGFKAQPDERGMSLLRWMDSPHPELRGKTPLELWEQGQRGAVVLALRSELDEQ